MGSTTWIPAFAGMTKMERSRFEMENKLPLPQAKPEEVGMSAERLARIRPALQSFITRIRTPIS